MKSIDRYAILDQMKLHFVQWREDRWNRGIPRRDGDTLPSMSADNLLSPLSDEARTFLARIGRRFGTQEVQAQAKRTLVAHGRFENELRLHGFSLADRDRLASARILATSLVRPDTKVTDRRYVDALGEAKTARARARSVLLSAYRRLRATGGPSPEIAQAMSEISAVISETGEPGGDDRVYAVHVSRLREVLAMKTVAFEVAHSGGTEADVMLVEALDTLRRVTEGDASAVVRDEDVVDGLIVELCRTAQFAAQSVAKELGDRSIAGEFRLVKLSQHE